MAKKEFSTVDAAIDILDAAAGKGEPFVVMNRSLYRYYMQAATYIGAENCQYSFVTEFGFGGIPSRVLDFVYADLKLRAPHFENRDYPLYQKLRGRLHPEAKIAGFRNGYLIMGGKHTHFVPPTARIFARAKHRDFDFDTGATCPRWMQFLDEVLPLDYHDVLQEWFGLNMVDEMKYQKFACWHGPARSGKSTASLVLMKLLGKSNVSNLQLENLAGFDIENLMGKLAMIVSDVNWVGKSQEAVIKSLVGRDRQHIKRKFKVGVNAELCVRITLVGNDPPSFHDASDAIPDRLLVFPFPNSLKPEDRDLELDAKLHSELPGIANWAIAGLQRLIANGKFSIPLVMQHEIDQLRIDFNPIASFVDECVVKVPGHKLLKDEVYMSYVEWCQAAGLAKPKQKSVFGKLLKSYLKSDLDEKRSSKPPRAYYYVGIQIEMPESEGGVDIYLTKDERNDDMMGYGEVLNAIRRGDGLDVSLEDLEAALTNLTGDKYMAERKLIQKYIQQHKLKAERDALEAELARYRAAARAEQLAEAKAAAEIQQSIKDTRRAESGTTINRDDTPLEPELQELLDKVAKSKSLTGGAK